MSNSDLTKQEALELITPVVDNEVGEELRSAFFNFIENDNDVRNQYESIKRLKEVVSTRCPCAKAPDRLHNRVRDFLATADPKTMADPQDPDAPIYDKPSHLSEADDQPPPSTPPPALTSESKSVWRYAAAAALLIIALITGIYFYSFNSAGTFNVEEQTYAHFTRNGGQMIRPTIATASLDVAESRLAEVFNKPITIPSLNETEFMGVVLSDFIPDFTVPMLEYQLPAENQYIYIFAFNVEELERFEKLVRSEEAVKSCIRSKDFHIKNVNGKYVVSWKWGQTWYSAISNHDGETLASLVDSLQ